MKNLRLKQITLFISTLFTISALVLFGYNLKLITFLKVFSFLLAGVGGGVWVFSRLDVKRIESFSVILFFGLSLRLLFMASFQFGYIGGPQNCCLGPDAHDYYQQGLVISQSLRGLSFSFNRLIEVVGSAHYGYSFFTGIIFSIFGPQVIFGKLVNVFIGVFSVILTFFIGRILYSNFVARIGALFVLFNPALIFWSSRHLKDTLYAFLLLLMIYQVLKIYEAHKLINILGFLIVLGVTFAVRGNLTYFVLLGLVIFLITSSALRGKYIGLLKVLVPLIILGLLVLPYVPKARTFLQRTLSGDLISSIFRKATSYWKKYDVERLGVEPSLGIVGFMKTIPLAIGTLLMAPLPWSASGVGLFKVPGALVRALVYPLSLYGIYVSMKKDWLKTFPLYLIPITVASALIVVVIGGMARYHVPMIAPMMLLASVAIPEFDKVKKFYLAYLVILFSTYVSLYYIQFGNLLIASLALLGILLIILSYDILKRLRVRTLEYYCYLWK